MNFRGMEEFWLFYMNQHSKPATRRFLFAGTLSSILCLIYAVLFNWWILFLVSLFGYGLGWYSHFFVEGNIPATFGHPIWSLLCDFRMFGLMLSGQMDTEIKGLSCNSIDSFSSRLTDVDLVDLLQIHVITTCLIGSFYSNSPPFLRVCCLCVYKKERVYSV